MVTGLVASVLLAAVAGLVFAPSNLRARRRVQRRLASPATGQRAGLTADLAPVGVAIAAVGLATAWLVAGPVVALALAMTAAVGPLVAAARRRAAARTRRDEQMPAALERLATALRAGSSLTQALGEVGRALDAPLGPELTSLARAAERGRPLRAVLDEWSTARGDAGTRLTATALVLSTVVGSAPARAVDGVASTLRDGLDLAAERRALAVQARTSALVLSVAPLGFTALLIVADTAAAGFLLGSPTGWACLVGGVALDAAGAWWMTHLSRGELQ